MASALATRASALTSETAWLATAWDFENVDLSSTDYTPACGTARGFIICGATGTVKIDTPAGTVAVTIPSGLATGIPIAIAFTKIYRTGTTATSIVALG